VTRKIISQSIWIQTFNYPANPAEHFPFPCPRITPAPIAIFAARPTTTLATFGFVPDRIRRLT
jgi:hypothetical protein